MNLSQKCEPHSGDSMVEGPNRGKAVRVQWLENEIGWDRTEGWNGERGWMMDDGQQERFAPELSVEDLEDWGTQGKGDGGKVEN